MYNIDEHTKILLQALRLERKLYAYILRRNTTAFQIRGNTGDNWKIIFLISQYKPIRP